MMKTSAVILGLLLLVSNTRGLDLPRPDLPWDSFYRKGDIMLGGIFPLHKYAPDKWCSDMLLGTLQTQFVQAMVFAVDRINQNTELLHNLTFGFVIYDDCAREMVALARALSFVGGPRFASYDHTPAVSIATPSTTDFTLASHVNSSVTNTENINDKNSSFSHQNDIGMTTEASVQSIDLDMTLKMTDMTSTIPYHKVMGVVGPMRSFNTILSAQLFTLFKIPQISAVSTADDLSNKVKYPYFLRMVPPDQNQAEAIVSFLEKFGWTYFSAIYAQGSYGLGGMNKVRRLARNAGMCVAYLKEINPTLTDTDFDDIIKGLRKHGNAKAVVVFANAQEAKGVIEAAGRANSHGDFVWIFSDGLSSLSSLGEHKYVVEGSFMVQLFSKVTPEFDDYFQGLNPNNNKDNPWFKKFWELYFKCSFSGNSEKQFCTGDEVISTNNGYKQDGRVSLFIDLIQTYGRAIGEIIERECYHFTFTNNTMAKFDREKLVGCIQSCDLIQYLKKQVFWGQIGRIKFDSHGDMMGLYQIKQVVKNHQSGEYELDGIALWGADRGLVTDEERIHWQIFTDSEVNHPDDIPVSVCSQPCGPGELVLIQEVPCCWECHKCRPNEVTKPDLKKCTLCTLGYWPSDDQMTCLPIEETYLSLPSVYAVVIVVITIASILVEGGVIVTFIHNRHDKLIKATSRELSFIILFGLTLGLLTVYALITRPNYPTCIFCRVAFHISVTICYAALLVRTNRIYRIFESGRRTTRRPPLISTTAQIIFTLILIAGQVVITSVTTVLFPPKPTLSMPIVDTRYVELSCDLPLKGLVIPLSYNLLLIAMSTFFAFKIRRLPENFNESKCIFVCACTTLFVFSAFLPTYFVALYSHYKSMLLSLCLILNADVILLMLFMPRVYALYWVDDQSIVYADTKGHGMNTGVTRSVNFRSNQSQSSNANALRAVSQSAQKSKPQITKIGANNKVAPEIEVLPNQE